MSRDSCCNSGMAVLSFLAGSVVGAAIALLTAPKSGRETREILADYGSEIKDKVGHFPENLQEYSDSTIDRGRELIERGKELISRGTELATEGKDYLDEKKRGLSEAIEAGKEAMRQEKESLAKKFSGSDEG